MKTSCVVCQQELLATIVMDGEHQTRIQWKNVPASNATLMPFNESVVKLRCTHCGILYDHEVT